MSDASTRDIYLFGTCLIDVLYPEAGMATVHLLEHFGYRVHFPQDQTCCGQPAYNAGFRDAAFDVAKRQLRLFPHAWPIVVPSGSCAGMFRHDYPELFQNTPQASLARDIASRVVELSAFLMDIPAEKWPARSAPEKTLVVHTSCSARRGLAQGSLAQALINRLPGLRALEPESASECCGFGGTFAVKQPEISIAMTATKCQALQATGTNQLVSGDCGCLMNLNGYLEQKGSSLKGEHLASFLWREIKARTSPSEGDQ